MLEQQIESGLVLMVQITLRQKWFFVFMAQTVFSRRTHLI